MWLLVVSASRRSTGRTLLNFLEDTHLSVNTLGQGKNMDRSNKNLRTARKDYIPVYIMITLAYSVVQGLISNYSRTAHDALMSSIPLIFIYATLLVYCSKGRCHDRDRSGAFALLYIVPLICVWPFIELVFLRGTVGTNKYGSDPLEERAANNSRTSTFAYDIDSIGDDANNEPKENDAACIISRLKSHCECIGSDAKRLRSLGYIVEVSTKNTQLHVDEEFALTARIYREY